MLDHNSATGYVRETTDSESAEFGRGFVAVLDDRECWHRMRDVAEAQLRRMQVRRGQTEVGE